MRVKGFRINKQNIRNILLIQLGDLGDVLLTFPCIRALHENFQGANIVVAVRDKAKDLIEDCPWATDVIAINQDKRRFSEEIKYQINFITRVRGFKFDLVFDLRTGDRGAIITLISRARQRISFYGKYNKLWRNRIFTHLMLPEKKMDQHMTEYYLSLFFAYKIYTSHIQPELNVPLKKELKATLLFKEECIPLMRPIVALQPFSLWRYKEWGIEKYSRLIDAIISKYNISVIILGVQGERQRAEQIVQACKKPVYNLAGKTSIRMLAAVLRKCSLLIGVDSFGQHISAAMGTPTVTIYGPSAFSAWAPTGEAHRIVHKDFPCVPCKLKGCNGSGFSRCLNELEVEEVLMIVQNRLDAICGKKDKLY